MSKIDDLLERNGRYAYSMANQRLDPAPSGRVAIVACMDARIDVYSALSLGDGEAHVLRNAGGVVTDDLIRSLAISQLKLGTREVMLIQHTDCGMGKITDEGFREELREATGATAGFEIGAFADVEQSVRDSIRRLRDCELLPHRDAVRGFVYDVDSHRLREVAAD